MIDLILSHKSQIGIYLLAAWAMYYPMAAEDHLNRLQAVGMSLLWWLIPPLALISHGAKLARDVRERFNSIGQ